MGVKMAESNRPLSTYSTEGSQLFRSYQTGGVVKSMYFETKSVWSYTIEDTTYPVIFYAPGIIDPGILPPNHPIWDHVDTVLEKIWAESTRVSPDTDDEWLENIRASWNNRIQELYDESDAGR